MPLPLSSCTFGLLLGDSTRLNASDAKHLDARSCDPDVVIRLQSGFASVIELGVGVVAYLYPHELRDLVCGRLG